MRGDVLYSPIYDRIGDILTEHGYCVTVLERDVLPNNKLKRYRSGASGNWFWHYSINGNAKIFSF